jgi:uncharacterized protein YcfJ
MKKLITAFVATALAGVMALPAPASAASFSMSNGSQDRYVQQQCNIHPNLRGCDDWQHNHHHWSKNNYQDWYRWNRPTVGNFASGLFGFVIGAAVANGLNNSNDNMSSSHVARCEDAYRSYNPRTDQFLGYDGRYHYCNL